MKGLLVKLIMLGCIGVGIINYMIYIKTGNSPLQDLRMTWPAMSRLGDFTFSGLSLPEMPHALTDKLTGEDTQPVKVYKWVDEQGVIHYAQHKPDEITTKALNITELMVDPNTNIIQADTAQTDSIQTGTAPSSASSAPINTMPAPAVTLLPDPQNVKKLMNDAKGVQALMDARAEQLNQTGH